MNKFLSLISDNSNATLVRRATAISEQACIAQQNVVNTLKQHISNLEIQISNLTDLSPDNKDSLSPMTKDWDPVKWAKDLQAANWDLYVAKQQLKIAEDTYKEYFTEITPKQD